MRESVGLMSAGRAFQACGPATKKALSETQSCVRRTAKFPPSVVAMIVHFCKVLWCDTMLDVKHHAAEHELYSAQHLQPVEPLSKR